MSEPGHWFERNPLWFKTAIFYEIHIRGFFDGNDDGSGDFRGLIEKLDYLQWLGIDCIWLLPMYQSPFGPFGFVRDSWNHGWSEEVWFITRSAMTRRPCSCADSMKVRTSSIVP